MYKQFYFVRCFFISLLLSIGISNAVNAQTLTVSRINQSTGADGATAVTGDIMLYTITVTNSTSDYIIETSLYGSLPAGTIYVTGSTTVNGIAVADVNGKMPFAGSGGLINSPSAAGGILAPNLSATVKFMAKVTTNGGNITGGYATLQGTHPGTTNTIFLNTAIESTVVPIDESCSNTIYNVTANIPAGVPSTYFYRIIKTISPSTGIGVNTIFNGNSVGGTDAITGATVPAASFLKYGSALGYDKNTNRLYFVNYSTTNQPEDLCYLEFNGNGTIAARKYGGHPLETTTGSGYNIERMTFAADGFGYAITGNGQDLIRFSVNPSTNLPIIDRLGPLVNDARNGANNVLAETGGDIFPDGSGNLYLIPNSGKLYRIHPVTRNAVYLGTISGMPSSVNSVAADYNGNVIVGGAYQNVYRVNLATMTAASITSGTSNVWTSGDFSSCTIPVLGASLKATKTYTNLSTETHEGVISGDPIEYTIEVTSSGNIVAGGVKLEDILPSGCFYTPGTTTMNGVAVADNSGAMPFSVNGGQLINSPAQPVGVVLPGDAGKVVIKFRVTTGMNVQVCNQADITLPDADGTTIKIITNDAASGQGSTCFFSKPGLTVVASNDGIINCYHPTVTLTAASPTPGLTYQWTGPGGFTAEGQSIVVNSPGYYRVTATGPTGTATMGVDVTRQYIQGGSYGSTSLINCANNGTQIYAYSGNGYSYQWTGPNGFTATTQTAIVHYGGDYIVTVSDPVTTGCSITMTVKVTDVRTKPQATITNSGILSCANPTVTLSATTTVANRAFLWLGPVDGPDFLYDTTATFVVNLPGTYTLFVEDRDNFCDTTLLVEVAGNLCEARKVTTGATNTQNANAAAAGVTQFTHAAYPNPVTLNSVIEFASPQNTAVTVGIYNTLGVCEKILYKGNSTAGQHYKVAVPANELHAGVYYYIINAGNKKYTGRLVIVK